MMQATDRHETGKARLRAKEWEGAVETFQAMVSEDPGDAEAWQFLGAAQSQQGSWPAAISAFRKAEALAPVARHRYNLAVALSEGLLRHDEARLYVERALETDPEHAPSKALLKQLVERTAAPEFDEQTAQRRISTQERQRAPVPMQRKVLGVLASIVIAGIASVLWFFFPFGILIAFGAGWLVGIVTAKVCGRGGTTAAQIASWSAGIFFLPIVCWMGFWHFQAGSLWNLCLDILTLFIAVNQARRIALTTD